MSNKATAIVPYKSKQQKAVELYDKRCSSLAKARAAKGKPLTKVKQLNRSISKMRKTTVNAVIKSTGAVCSILNSIPHVLDLWARELKSWVRTQKRNRRK
jgi:hypothetical protein